MCGIAGILELGGSATPRAERTAELAQMIALLGHRGPDEAGYLVDERVALAAVRLSITDLLHGHQPMGDETRRFWIVFNGEIYNHVELRAELEERGHTFATRCDTEVALRAWMEWGERAPARFDGGFAFVVYERSARRAFLVRDRFGKRPLYYTIQGGSLRFGSEVKAFLARPDHDLRWDRAALAALFGQWTTVGSGSPFEGVRQVPGGTILSLEAGAPARELGYARFPLPEEGDMPFEAAADAVRARLTDAVRIRLRGDVEVGVLLSGGLDSTIVTYLVHRIRQGRLRAFSVSFADAQYDESGPQDRVASALGLTHSRVHVGAGDIAASFEDALWHAEVPQFRTAFVPMYLLARHIRASGIKVALSGEGADEVFLGYDIFKEARLRASWGELEPAARRDRLRRLYPYLPHFSEANLRPLEALFGRTAAGAAGTLYSHFLRFENGRFALRLLGEDLPAGALEALGAQAAALPGFSGLSPVRRAQWLEFHTLLQGYLLSSQGDRMMFAHGVEPRCPFLGPEVVSFAATLPERYHLSADDDEKHLLKEAFRDIVPDEIRRRPKQPYRAPDAAAFLDPAEPGRFLPWVEARLTASALQALPIDATHAEALVAKLRDTPPGRISPREDQAFLLLLSTATLDRLLVRRRGLERGALVAPPLARVVELDPEVP